LSFKFCLLIKVNYYQYNMTFFKIFSLNSFMLLLFASKFNLICWRLRHNKGSFRKRIREGKWKINYPIGFNHYGYVHYSGRRFYVWTRVNIICYRFFISFTQFFIFTFKLKLNKTRIIEIDFFKKQIIIWASN
jgi:hypothetical protein